MTESTAPEINWTLLQELREKPHHAYRPVKLPPEVHVGVAEVLNEAQAVQHLLDMIGVPAGHGYDADLDARAFLAVRLVIDLRERFDRISGWHSREAGPAGTVGDFCNECGTRWPCDTRRMADGTYTDEERR